MRDSQGGGAAAWAWAAGAALSVMSTPSWSKQPPLHGVYAGGEQARSQAGTLTLSQRGGMSLSAES
jgi:hypothetical protein